MVSSMVRTGRPRMFDEADMAARARDVFWRRGYNATSMRELAEATGVLPGSVYATIGDKHALFLRALAVYADDTRLAAAWISASTDVASTLRELLTSVLSAAIANPGRGCMLGNTAAELAPHDQAAATVVRDAFRDLETAIARAIESAQQRGEIPVQVHAASQAVLLVTMMQGLHIVARTEPDLRRLYVAIDAAMLPFQHA